MRYFSKISLIIPPRGLCINDVMTLLTNNDEDINTTRFMDQDLKPFLQSVQLHHKIDYIYEVMVGTWSSYNSTNKKSQEYVHEGHLIRSYGNRLACIAFAYNSTKSPWKCTKTDLHLHLNWYLDLGESFTEDNSDLIKQLEIAIQNSKHFKGKVSQKAISFMPANIFLARIMRSQWDYQKSSFRWLERHYTILKRTLKNYRDVNSAYRIQKRIDLHLGMTIEELVRTGMCIFTSAINSKVPGVVQFFFLKKLLAN